MEGAVISYPPRYSPQALNFYSHYDQESFVHSPAEKLKGLKHQSMRVCRFCKKKAGETSFRKEAHVLPYALGNRYLVSDFECDACNEKFGRYENDLVKYLGIARTIARTESRKGVPGFRSKDIKAKEELLFNLVGAIKMDSGSPDKQFRIDGENNRRIIRYTKPPYIPLNVYKAILKMALCTIKEEDVEKYPSAFKLLSTDAYDSRMAGLKLFGYRLPLGYSGVFAELFKKRGDSMNTITHTFILYFDHFMFQIFLPFNIDDKKHQEMMLHLKPPVFDGSGDAKWVHTNQIADDLSSHVVRDNDQDAIVMEFSPIELKNAAWLDPVTRKEIKNYKPAPTAGVYLMRGDFSVKIAKDSFLSRCRERFAKMISLLLFRRKIV